MARDCPAGRESRKADETFWLTVFAVRRRQWQIPSDHSLPSITSMQSQIRRESNNSVNRSVPNPGTAASPGRDCDVRQVTPDRQPITVRKSTNKEKGKIQAFKGYLAVSDRIILLKMKGPQRDLNIIQVYAPTEAAQNEEINEYYGKLEETRRKCKTNEILVVMGDLNAKVGKIRDGNTVGPFGLGVRNECGDLWVDWCRNNKLIIANTWLQNHPRRLWTWQSPDDTTRNQIDFIAISERYKNGVLNCRAFPGADVGSDHVPVLATLRVKLKTCQSWTMKMPKLDYEKCLKDNAVRMNLQRHFNNEITRSHAKPPCG